MKNLVVSPNIAVIEWRTTMKIVNQTRCNRHISCYLNFDFEITQHTLESNASNGVEACHVTPEYNPIIPASPVKGAFFQNLSRKAPIENSPRGATIIGRCRTSLNRPASKGNSENVRSKKLFRYSKSYWVSRSSRIVPTNVRIDALA